MKCWTSFSLAKTHFRKLWEASGFAIFKISISGSGPLFTVGPDEIRQLRNRSRWLVFDTWEQAYYVTTKKCWPSLPPEVASLLEE
jgi:hypothetical protein